MFALIYIFYSIWIHVLSLKEYFNMRVQSVKNMRAAGKNPYPHKFHVSMSLTDFIEKFSSMEAGLSDENSRISLAGLFIDWVGYFYFRKLKTLKVAFTPNGSPEPSWFFTTCEGNASDCKWWQMQSLNWYFSSIWQFSFDFLDFTRQVKQLLKK